MQQIKSIQEKLEEEREKVRKVTSRRVLSLLFFPMRLRRKSDMFTLYLFIQFRTSYPAKYRPIKPSSGGFSDEGESLSLLRQRAQF